MSTAAAETPVLDLLATMTAASVERSELDLNGGLLVRVGYRGAADGQRPRHQAALGAAVAGALATTTASSAATGSRGSARPAPLAVPAATIGLRPVLPR
jgi:hypothetical protein